MMQRHLYRPAASQVTLDSDLERSSLDLPRPCAKAPERSESVQICRGIAAISVMMFHLLDTMRVFYATKPFIGFETGAIGVDLFFVISGFVMMLSSKKHFKQPGAMRKFLTKRVIRIVPLYWTVMIVHAGLVVLQQRYGVLRVDVIGASLIFWPYKNGSGNLYPFFPLGWTLNFEMFFYFVFSLTLWMMPGRALILMFTIFVTLVIIGQTLAVPDVLVYWTNPIILEFLIGLTIGYLAMRGYTLRRDHASVMLVSGSALVLGAIISGYHAGPPGMEGEMTRCFIWGIPCGLILAGLTLKPWQAGPGRILFLALGDASYSIYLLHIPVFTSIRLLKIFELLQRFIHTRILTEIIYIALATSTAISLALVCHFKIEKPVLRAIGKRLGNDDERLNRQLSSAKAR